MYIFWKVVLFGLILGLSQANDAPVTTNDPIQEYGVNEDLPSLWSPAPRPVKYQPSQSLDELTSKYKKILESGLKPVIPLVLQAAKQAELSGPCMLALAQTIIGVRQLKEWAMSMLDATGKVQSGLFDGTSSDFGDYDECMAISAKRSSIRGQDESSFSGQYCLVEFLPPRLLRVPTNEWAKTNSSILEQLKESETIFHKLVRLRHGVMTPSTRIGVCLPSVCSREDLRRGLQLFTEKLEIEVEIVSCSTEPAGWGSEQVGFVTIFGIWVVLVFFGTLLDIVSRRRKDLFSNNRSRNDGCSNFWRSLSLFSSIKHFGDTRQAAKDIFCCTRGIRVLTMLWLVLSNCYFFPFDGFFYRFKRLLGSGISQDDVLYGFLANPTPAIDSLFFMSGLLFSYERGQRILFYGEALLLWKCFARRFLRFLPSMIFTIWLFLLFPLFGNGPLWEDLVTKNVDVCRNTWWRNVIFIQNFWGFRENCMFHTWLLSVMVQFSFVSIILVSLLYRKPRLGLFVNVAVIAGTSFVVGYYYVLNEFPPNLNVAAFDLTLYEDIMNKDYLRTYTHIGPFCVGLLLGYLFAKREKLRLNIIAQAIGWFFCLGTICAILFGLCRFPYEGELFTSMSALFAATYRLGWSLCIAWVCAVSATGSGGFVNDFLSMKIFVQLDKLSYFIYLLNPLVIFYYTGRARERIYFGHPEMILNFLGVLFVTLILSFVVYNFLQYPLHCLEKSIFFRKKDKNEDDEVRDALDPVTIINMYRTGASLGGESNVSMAVLAPKIQRRRRSSSVAFVEAPEILTENSRRSIPGDTFHDNRRRKSSMKLDVEGISRLESDQKTPDIAENVEGEAMEALAEEKLANGRRHEENEISTKLKDIEATKG